MKQSSIAEIPSKRYDISMQSRHARQNDINIWKSD